MLFSLLRTYRYQQVHKVQSLAQPSRQHNPKESQVKTDFSIPSTPVGHLPLDQRLFLLMVLNTHRQPASGVYERSHVSFQYASHTVLVFP